MKKLLLALTLASVALSAKAEVVLSETFTYPDGPIVGAVGSPWATNSGTAGSAVVTNNMLAWSSARSEDITAPLSGAPYQTNGAVAALYSSFTVKFAQLPSASGAYFAHFKDAGNAFRARIWSSTTAAAAGTFRLGIGNSSGASATTGQITTDLTTNTTYTVVTRYTLATGLSTIWLNPASEADAGVTASDAVGVTNMTHYSFRQASGIGTLAIDDLKVGTSFTDVASGDITLNPPTISTIASQRISANASTGPIAFTIGDGETPVAALTLSGTSTNATLVPNGNIIFGGSGATRTVTVTPAAGQQGTTLITVTVTDGNANTSSRSFTVTVGAPNISAIATQEVAINSVGGPVGFTVSDAETAAGSLTVTTTSSNQTLIPDSNIVLGGSGSNRTITLTPVTDQIGFSTITVSVTDGTLTETTSFLVTVSPIIGLILDEPFTYSDGPIADGISNPFWISHSGTFGQTLVVNGQLSLNSTNTEDINRELPGRPFYPTNAPILYTSFDVNFSQLPRSEYFAHFKDTGTLNLRGRIFATTNNAGAGKFRIGVANNAGAVNTIFNRDLDLGTAYKIVTKFSAATGVTTLWLDPSNQASTSVTASDSPSSLTIDSFAFRQAANIGTLLVDNLKIGGAFSNVVTVVNLPELVTMNVAKVGSSIQISWTTSDSAYALQSTSTVNANWATASETPVQNGTTYTVTINSPSGNKFYRLIK